MSSVRGSVLVPSARSIGAGANHGSGTIASSPQVMWSLVTVLRCVPARSSSVEHRADLCVGGLADEAEGVEGVAHLAVERVFDGRTEPRGVGGGMGDDPGPAGPVEAHRDSRLGGDRAELFDRRTRAACDRQGQAPVGEQRVAARSSGRVDERKCT